MDGRYREGKITEGRVCTATEIPALFTAQKAVKRAFFMMHHRISNKSKSISKETGQIKTHNGFCRLNKKHPKILINNNIYNTIKMVKRNIDKTKNPSKKRNNIQNGDFPTANRISRFALRG